LIESLSETQDKFFFEINIENFYHYEVQAGRINLRTDGFSLWLNFENEIVEKKFRKVIEKFCVLNDLDLIFKIIKKIDKGGFGTVYKAENKNTGELIALKKIDKSIIKTVKNYVRKSIKILEVPS